MRRFALFVVMLCVLLCAALPAQADFAWTLRIDTPGSVSAAAMYLLPEGGAYLAGAVEGEADFDEELGETDAYVARVDMDGTLMWQRRLGGSEDERFTHIIEGLGGGCVALGVTESQDGDCRAARGMQDAFLVRLDEMGEVIWTKCLGGTADDELLAITVWEEGGYLVCGRTQSRNGDLGANYGGWDAWAMLLGEADGKPQWVVRYGEDGNEAFTQILPAYDRWTLVGQTSPIVEEEAQKEEQPENGEKSEDENAAEPLPENEHPLIVSLDPGGNILWEQSLGGEGKSVLTGALEIESGWMLTGQTNSRSALMPTGHGGHDLWVVQLRQAGSVSWQRAYGGSHDEAFHTILPAAAGGYVYLASTESSDGQVSGTHGGRDVWVVKTSALGTMEWQQALGGSGHSEPVGIIPDGTGGYYVAGNTDSTDGDIGAHVSMQTGFLARLAPNGNLTEMKLVGGGEEFFAVSLQKNEEGAYLLGVVNRAETTGVASEIWLSKMWE